MRWQMLRPVHLLRCLLLVGGTLAGLYALPAVAQAAGPLSRPALDSVVAQARRTWQVPGVAVAVVQDGRLVLAQGYGVRSLATQEPVTAHTLFDVGSVTQSFTAAALSLLVAQGQLRWSDRLADYLPEQLPTTAASFSCADAPAHPHDPFFASYFAEPEPATRLGSAWPLGPPAATIRALVADARYLAPAVALDPRTAPSDPDAPNYRLAGELLARATGRPWPELVAARLLGPLGLVRSGPYLQLPDPTNVAAAHAQVRGRVRVVPRDIGPADDPSGSFYSSAADLSRWVGQWLASPGAVARPEAGRAVAAGSPAPVVAAFGLAWRYRLAQGYQVLTHQGGRRGMRVQLVLLPELRLGIIVLANQEEAEAALAAISAFVLRGCLPPVPVRLPGPAPAATVRR